MPTITQIIEWGGVTPPRTPWTWAPKSSTGPVCPSCDCIHGGMDVRAVDRFNPAGPAGFRADFPGAPLRDTRAEAHTDMCDFRRSVVHPG
jgi:hypothetical protein